MFLNKKIMAKQILFLLFILFVSEAHSLNLKANSKSKIQNTSALHDPRNGSTISLRKMKDNKLQAISFISEMQNSLSHYSKCIFNLIKIIIRYFFRESF